MMKQQMQAMMSMMSAVQSGAHYILHSAGFLDGLLSMSYEKFVLDTDLCGALHAYLWRGVGFESFTLHHSISYLAMAIVGGLGTLVGSFFGPLAILMLELQVENFAEFVGHYFTAVGDVATAFRPLSFGLVIVLFLMFEPRGIANWWRIARSYFKLWPFRY